MSAVRRGNLGESQAEEGYLSGLFAKRFKHSLRACASLFFEQCQCFKVAVESVRHAHDHSLYLCNGHFPSSLSLFHSFQSILSYVRRQGQGLSSRRSSDNLAKRLLPNITRSRISLHWTAS